MTGGALLVKLAPHCQRLLLDPRSAFGAHLSASAVDIRRRQSVQALVMAFVVVVVDERCDLGLQRSRQVMVLQQDPVLHRAVVAFDLPLGHWMIGLAAGVADAVRFDHARGSTPDPQGAIRGDTLLERESTRGRCHRYTRATCHKGLLVVLYSMRKTSIAQMM